MTDSSSSSRILLAALERIDLLIQLQIWRARQLVLIDESFQGLYIAEEEIDALLDQPVGLPRWATVPLPLANEDVQTALRQIDDAVDARCAELATEGRSARLDRLCADFKLSVFERDALLICLAPEIDLRYERFFGYLQDDITKRRPSVDLVLNLLSPTLEAKLAARRHFAPTAPLRKQMLLHLFEDASQPHPPLLARYLRADDRVPDLPYTGRRIQGLEGPVTQNLTYHLRSSQWLFLGFSLQPTRTWPLVSVTTVVFCAISSMPSRVRSGAHGAVLPAWLHRRCGTCIRQSCSR